MAISDNAKIAFGVVAATGVVLLSYVFFKMLGSNPDDHPPPRRKSKTKTRKPQTMVQEKTIDKASSSGVVNKQQEKKTTAQGDVEGKTLAEDISNQDNTSNQTSFIIIDPSAQESLPGNEGPPSSKKSDRSSDDSSFDVVEAGGEEEDVEKISHKDPLEDGTAGDNESSMIIVDEPSVMETSASFYHSADETLPKDLADSSKKTAAGKSTMAGLDEEDRSESASTSGSEPTVMYSVNSKLLSQDVTDGSKVTSDTKQGTVRGGHATGDKIKKTLDSEANTSLALSTSAEAGDKSKSAPVIQPATSLAKEAKPEGRKVLTTAETTRTLTMVQNSASTVSKTDVYNLVELLRMNDPNLKPTVLDCIVRVSLFKHNNKYLHEAGCGQVLSERVQDCCKDVIKGNAKAQQAMEDLSGALTNLSLDPTFMPQLEGSVSPLVDVLLLESVPESLRMSTLRPLTNLSTDTAFPQVCKRGISQLYALLDKGPEPVRVQSLKILVNLSLVQDIVPHLLSAKAPTTLLDLMGAPSSNDVILRTVTLLGHIYSTIGRDKLTQSSLPTSEKADSPSTMYTNLCGTAELPPLRNKVYCLTRHEDKEIGQLASKLYHFVTQINK